MSVLLNPPAELWAIELYPGHLVPPIDDDGTDVFMVWPSKEEAEKGLEHQRQWFDENDSPKVVQIR